MKCEVPQSGSYLLPAFVESVQPQLATIDQVHVVRFDLESIGTLDLSPLEVNEVEHAVVRLRFKETVRLQPRLNDENPQFVGIEEPRLGLDAFAGTVSDLLDEVAEDLVVVWKHYAQAPDATLSPKALELKHRLLDAMEEVPVVG